MNVTITEINGKEYAEIDKIEIKGITYVFLSNITDDKDFLIRKLSIEENKVYYIGLDSEEEFNNALVYFTKKHENLLKEI